MSADLAVDLSVDTDVLRRSAEAARDAAATIRQVSSMTVAGEPTFVPTSLGPAPGGPELVTLAQRRVRDAVDAVGALMDGCERLGTALDGAAVTFASTESMVGPR